VDGAYPITLGRKGRSLEDEEEGEEEIVESPAKTAKPRRRRKK
jgi:hypothetical protein